MYIGNYALVSEYEAMDDDLKSFDLEFMASPRVCAVGLSRQEVIDKCKEYVVEELKDDEMGSPDSWQEDGDKLYAMTIEEGTVALIIVRASD